MNKDTKTTATKTNANANTKTNKATAAPAIIAATEKATLVRNCWLSYCSGILGIDDSAPRAPKWVKALDKQYYGVQRYTFLELLAGGYEHLRAWAVNNKEEALTFCRDAAEKLGRVEIAAYIEYCAISNSAPSLEQFEKVYLDTITVEDKQEKLLQTIEKAIEDGRLSIDPEQWSKIKEKNTKTTSLENAALNLLKGDSKLTWSEALEQAKAGSATAYNYRGIYEDLGKAGKIADIYVTSVSAVKEKVYIIL